VLFDLPTTFSFYIYQILFFPLIFVSNYAFPKWIQSQRDNRSRYPGSGTSFLLAENTAGKYRVNVYYSSWQQDLATDRSVTDTCTHMLFGQTLWSSIITASTHCHCKYIYVYIGCGGVFSLGGDSVRAGACTGRRV